MGIKRPDGEVLPTRRRPASVRKAIPKRRCMIGVFSVSFISFLALHYYTWINTGALTRFEVNISKPPKPKSHKRHAPCEIDFRPSVDYLIEPKTYINSTQFSLNFISHDRISLQNYQNAPCFGGRQTLEERENSFYAKNQTLHCGFVKENQENSRSSFELDERDKKIMSNCKVVVSSCIFGNSDFIRRPTRSKMSKYTKENVCFMMFMDQITLSKLSSEGNGPDQNGNIGLWRVILVKNLPYIDLRKTGKVPKFLSHRLFPSSRYSIWVDSKMRLNTDPMLIIEYFLWRRGAEFAISRHYDRKCVWEEVLQNKKLNKYNHTLIDEQFLFYQSDGLVRFNESDPYSPLPSFVPEGSFIVRAHTSISNLFSCLWFNEVNRFTSRDQLSFGYTYLKLKRFNPQEEFRLNMFLDCERRKVAKLFQHRILGLELPPGTL